MKNIKLAIKGILLAAAISPCPTTIQACTLWGAAGTSSAEGTLLVKNRDWLPDHSQSLRLIRPARGLAYLGLYADGGRAPGIKAGVNRSGLSVVSASASSLARKVREQDRERHGIIGEILNKFHSLDEVAANANNLFSKARPIFLYLADSSGLMQVEIGQDGRFHVERKSNGTAAHTNHYFDTSVLKAEQHEGNSSETRLARIDQLLADSRGNPWKLSDFSRISQDQNDGPDNSLWRSGHEHTLASWQISLPASGAGHLHLVMANPGQTVSTRDFLLDDAFWSAPAGKIL